MDNPLTSPEEFQEWKAHRLTQAFLAYLAHQRTEWAALWAAGHPLETLQQGQAVQLGLVLDLTCNDVREAYGMEALPNAE